MAPAPGFDASSARPWGDARSRSIWQWQLILAFSTVAIALAVALLDSQMFGDPSFGIGIVLIVLISATTLVVPWPRVPRWAVMLVPALDIIAIALMSANNDVRLGFLWTFPVVWIATYYRLAWLMGALALIAGFSLSAALRGGLTPDLALRVLIVLLALGFMGITIHIGSRRTRAFSRLLRRQFTQLSRTLHRVEAQEQHASTMFNALDTGLARVDERGGLLAANDAYRELYSIGEIGYAHPTTAVEYDGYKGTALSREATSLARAARRELFDEERIWLFDAAGSWHALDVSTRLMDAGAVEAASTLLIVRDVTATVKAAFDRQTMTSVVSHELRNPLTAIAGHADLLLERNDLPQDVLDQLAVIENASQRMQRLITSALDTERPPRDETTRPVDVSALVAASVDAFRPAAQLALVQLTAQIDESLGATGDAFRLRQVVDNLVGNAVKYTLRGGTVTVTTVADGDDVELIVADSGIGISSADLTRVFDPYFRAESARSSGVPGTGLGMGISLEIIEQHHGTLEITSTLGRGTRATVRLPRHGGHRHPSDALSLSSETSSA